MLMAFDEVFPDAARRDRRTAQAVDAKGRMMTFALLDSHCFDPRCDCRQGAIDVIWVEKARLVAAIFVDLRPMAGRKEPVLVLDPGGPQNALAHAGLDAVARVLANEPGYVGLLREHHEMMKQAAGDRAGGRGAAARTRATRTETAATAAGRARAGDSADATVRPGGRRRAGAGAGSAGPAAGAALVAAKAARGEGTLQRRFRTLLAKVDRLKQQVRAWSERRGDLNGAIAVFVATSERQHATMRELAVMLDGMFGRASFAKAEKKKLAAMICALTGELLEAGGHDDLKAIYNRHSVVDFDSEEAEAEAARAQTMRSMLEMVGVEFGDADVSTGEKLQAFAAEQLRAAEAQAVADEERRARRQKSPKQAAAEAQRADERQRADKALQDLYRTLALALHPDREQDQAERARKTELMREVNVAYEAKDLLRLLELQLELEHMQPEQAETLAEDRLRHYNRILDEQARQLAEELEVAELPFLAQLDGPPTSVLTPAQVMARIGADTRALEQRIAELGRDLELFAEPARLKAWLKRRRADEWTREAEPDLFDLFG